MYLILVFLDKYFIRSCLDSFGILSRQFEVIYVSTISNSSLKWQNIIDVVKYHSHIR